MNFNFKLLISEDFKDSEIFDINNIIIIKFIKIVILYIFFYKIV